MPIVPKWLKLQTSKLMCMHAPCPPPVDLPMGRASYIVVYSVYLAILYTIIHSTCLSPIHPKLNLELKSCRKVLNVFVLVAKNKSSIIRLSA